MSRIAHVFQCLATAVCRAVRVTLRPRQEAAPGLPVTGAAPRRVPISRSPHQVPVNGDSALPPPRPRLPRRRPLLRQRLLAALATAPEPEAEHGAPAGEPPLSAPPPPARRGGCQSDVLRRRRGHAHAPMDECKTGGQPPN